MRTNTLKLWLLPLLFALLPSSVYLMPRSGAVADSSISMKLPLGLNPDGWYGSKRQESEAERALLADDTEFSKADYVQQLPISLSTNKAASPALCHVSIVKSGHDLNNSIHRPERCLPAQGHFNLTSQKVRVNIEGHGAIAMTKLKSQQNVTPEQTQPTILDNMHYYVFFGHHRMTENHITRTLLDMKDRVLYGTDQRWSYFQISTPYGHLVNIPEETAREQTERLISQLLSQLVKWDEIK